MENQQKPSDFEGLFYIYYERGLTNTKQYAAFVQHTYDENEAIIGEGYGVSSDSFKSNKSSSSSVDQHRVEQEIDDYKNNMPSKLAHYISDEDISSDLGNGFKNLARD